MSEARPSGFEPGSDSADLRAETADQTSRPAKRPSRMFSDPLVVRMSHVALALVILFLVTVISVLITGVLNPGAPRTLAEKEIAVSAAAVRAGSADPADWGTYAATLIAGGQYARARGAIREGRESTDDSATAEFTVAEARLYHAQKQYDSAIESADAAMKQVKDAHDALISRGGVIARSARLDGMSENYYSMILLKAYIYRDTGAWDKAVAQYDLYIEQYPTAADILIDRGLARIEAGDTQGAEDDLRQALAFMPDDEQALDALDSIGVTP